MESPEDKSAVLFPLFEREGKLKSEISKEYYRTRVAIDKVLTPAQRDTLREKMAKQREQREKGRKK
jgi:Spy/CpxP family protein refolding chaperone